MPTHPIEIELFSISGCWYLIDALLNDVDIIYPKKLVFQEI